MVVLNVIGLLFAYAVAIWFIEQLGRRATFTIGWCGYLLGALFGLLSVTLFHAQSSWVVLFIAGTVIHMNIGICGQGTGLYAPELFPTRMRGFATSSGRAVALVAGTISPMVVGWLFASKLGITGYYGFLVVMAIVGLINFRVRGIETRGVMLEELSR
jgi:putative MFS transporter